MPKKAIRIALISTATMVALLITISTINRYSGLGKIAKIEQIRSDIAIEPKKLSDCKEFSNILIKYNAMIAREKQLNKMPISDWFITDKWNNVDYLLITPDISREPETKAQTRPKQKTVKNPFINKGKYKSSDKDIFEK